ncbi:hypothetical protein [Paenirhodobacter populi]|uniref:hypothetical protein n=1 Tax=Paenirhodobacter populi TaxID=2306993 RepID=UPI0013E2E8FD|nr:hypothetical protein [Sinirhodobacter populi]
MQENDKDHAGALDRIDPFNLVLPRRGTRHRDILTIFPESALTSLHDIFRIMHAYTSPSAWVCAYAILLGELPTFAALLRRPPDTAVLPKIPLPGGAPHRNGALLPCGISGLHGNKTHPPRPDTG